MKPSTRTLMTVGLLAGALSLADGAQAQDDETQGPPEDLEVTMKLMPEGAELPEAVTKTIALPTDNETALEASEPGLSRANEARAARDQGLDTAAEARENGRELGEQMAEQARENREDAGRGEPPEPPAGPPDDPPGPPEGL